MRKWFSFPVLLLLLFGTAAHTPPLDTETLDTVESDEGESEEKEVYPEYRRAQESQELVDDLSEEIKRVNNQMVSLGMQMDEEALELSGIKSDISEFEESLLHIEREQEYVRSSLHAFIRFLYESRTDLDPLASFFRSHSFAEFLNREYYVSDVVSSFWKKIDEYEDLDALIIKRKKELSDIKNELEQKQADHKKTQKEFNNQIKLLGRELKDAKKQAESAAEAARQLNERLARMQEAERLTLEYASPSVLGESSSWNENLISDGGDYWKSKKKYDPADSDLVLLAGIIQAEAGNQPYEGKIAVGSVVMNRVESPSFPNTISGVVYSPNQFTPAGSGRLAVVLAEGPTDECLRAAADVLSGTRNVSNLYFKSADYAAAHGITGIQIADQVFH